MNGIFVMHKVLQAPINNLPDFSVGRLDTVGLGMRVERQRFLFIALSVVLASSAVGIARGISFVGLMAPHMARKLIGNQNRAVIAAAAILGAWLVLLADLSGRTFFVPMDIPAGIFTSLLGAPFFVYLMYKRTLARSG
ncbi:iron ABC transporter permease [Paenibacillus thiaminolyticus]|uniref:FecCD family ABC transporter permease n=1 Tax=Paenibacillus thiaminolyticus TaxID=49283 RepID=UPI0035A70D82